jgi:hypothetical protein
MNTSLLKISNMKKFVKWMEVRSVHIGLWDIYNPLGKIYKGLEHRQKIADERDSFINKKRKTRKSWRMAFTRYGRLERTLDVYGFIIRRLGKGK